MHKQTHVRYDDVYAKFLQDLAAVKAHEDTRNAKENMDPWNMYTYLNPDEIPASIAI